MRTSWGWGVVAVLVAGPAVAAEPKVKTEPVGKLVRESWDAAFLQGQKAGYYHTTVHEFTREGQAIRRVTQELHMTVRRNDSLNVIHAENGDEENADRKVVGIFFKQGLAKNLDLNVTGQIDGKIMRIKVQQAGRTPFERHLKWDDDVIGLLSEETILKDRKAKPGDRITYRLYTPVVNSVVKTEITVKEWENVANGSNRKLLRVESKPNKIQDIQLPSQTLWFDDEYRLVRSQVEMPGLGELTLVRTTKAEAQKPNGNVPNLFDIQSIVLNQRLINPHGQSTVVYRVTLTGKDINDIEKTFATGDGRQEIKNIKGNTFELHVQAVRGPKKVQHTEDVKEEFTQSNFFVNSDDKDVRKLAGKAVGDEADPWKKARMIESWVNRNMKMLNFDNGIATADHVARTLEGDCTEFAMLAAAMCRAEGVPSRTALGLVYHVDKRTPKLSYHMWLEVFVNGQWIALDPTLGMNSVGAAHLKISDHSWYETRSMEPLLPVMRVMTGKPKIEILKVGD